MTEQQRLAKHMEVKAHLINVAQLLINDLADAALNVHDEIEELRDKIETLETMHTSPASHGRNHEHHT